MVIAAAAVEDVIFDVSNLLRIPVLVIAIAALVLVLVELGALAVELRRRRRHDAETLERVAVLARGALATSGSDGAAAELRGVASSSAMETALARLAAVVTRPGAETRLAKLLADFDLASIRRLERTRLLVRAGPALGLMGTLIPLSPALSGLASGNVARLTDNLRVAFSITVLGLLVGAIAFAISLVRDRLYAQDLSDLEFVAAVITEPAPETAVVTP